MQTQPALFFSLRLAVLFLLASCQEKPTSQPVKPDHSQEIVKEEIRTVNAPQPIGPYSQAVLVGNTLYLAGQIGIDPKTGELVQDSLPAEAKQVMTNLEAVLKEAEMDFGDVVQTTIYLTDLSDFGKVNELYGSYFSDIPPARVTVQVSALPKNARLEIGMIAVKTNP